jgi:hypothetical protein
MPNYEVKEFLISNLLSVYTKIMGGHLKKLKDKTYDCILNKDPEGLKEVLEEIYSQISYQNKKKSEGNKKKSEGLYHAIFIIILYLFGIERQSETSMLLTGRIEYSH